MRSGPKPRCSSRPSCATTVRSASCSRPISDPAVFDAQVRRMLSDPRANALADNFAGQWLELRKLEEAAPDQRTFPNFDRSLRNAFRTETEMFFETIVRDDRPISELLTA